MITVRPITAVNWRESLTLGVLPDQQRFIADHNPIALVGLAKAYVRASGYHWQPLAFYTEEHIVGFCTLAIKPGSEHVCWLFHFFIDVSFQRQGLGKSSMQALIEHIKQTYAACQTVHLTVHPDNIPAQRLYQGVGFQTTGEQLFGEPVFALKLV